MEPWLLREALKVLEAEGKVRFSVLKKTLAPMGLAEVSPPHLH